MVRYYESPEAEDVPGYRENDELAEDDQQRNAHSPNDSHGTIKAGGFHDVSHTEDKLLRRFSAALISRALESSWDDEEVARLVVLIAQERELSTKKTLKLLRKCSICKPALLARLGDEGLAFTDQQIIGVVYEQCRGVDQFIDTMGEVFEQGLLDFRKGREDEVAPAVRMGACHINHIY
jgi:hypothetical protein